ncbi:MAG: MFS transporter [Leucobacter sp.]
MTSQRPQTSQAPAVVRAPFDRSAVVRWVRTVPVVFLLVGLAFGTWLSRLPAVRDHLDAGAAEMSAYGLCLAAGGLAGLIISGRIIQRFGPRPTLVVGALITAVTLPIAAAITLSGATVAGLAMLFVFGIAFSLCDVAMNVSGANAEAAFGKPRMPLMHAGYSLGTVAGTGLGGVAEALHVPIIAHFIAVMAVSTTALLILLRNLPGDEQATRAIAERAAREGAGSASPASRQPDAASADHGRAPGVAADPDAERAEAPAGSDPEPGRAAGSARPYNPWRDPRVVLIGLLTLSFGLYEGTSSDWLPLALVDGRDFSNQLGTTMLSVFFIALMASRLAGSWLIERFGRVAVLRASAVSAMAGVVLTVLLPGTWGVLLGVIAWGLGSGLGWPISISAAADRPETAARDVATVSALGYGSMLIGPMAFGFLGERIGLLTSFWALLPFGLYMLIAATMARPRSGG